MGRRHWPECPGECWRHKRQAGSSLPGKGQSHARGPLSRKDGRVALYTERSTAQSYDAGASYLRWGTGSFGAGVAETGCHMMTMFRGAMTCEMATALKPLKDPHGRGSWSGQATANARRHLMKMRRTDSRAAPKSRRPSPLYSRRNGTREALLARRQEKAPPWPWQGMKQKGRPSRGHC